jgi:glutaredoxin-like protein NrdH
MAMEHVNGKNAGDIKLYALSTCPWCQKTKKLLNEMGLEYDFVDVDLLKGAEKEQTMKIVQKWNPGRSFPTLVINDSQAIIGFKEQEIKDALKASSKA